MSLAPTGAWELSNRLAGSDPEQALAIAREIEEPWFKCQALSHVARYWPHDDYQSLLKEAVKAADSQGDRYKRVTVSAWPVRAYLERGCATPAKALLERQARESANIENMGSRSEALFMLFQAAKPFAEAIWRPVFWALVEATEPALAWRQRRNLRLAAMMIASDGPALVQKALARLSDGKTISAIKRDVENRKRAEPRPFFWLA